MIKLENVTKIFPNHTTALDKISFEIKTGGFVFITGPSGAGKTTLLRLILREILPTSGSIFVNNQDIVKISPSKVYELRRKIGVVFQDFKLLNDRSVFENIALSLEVLDKSKNEIDKEVLEILHLTGLEEQAYLFPSQLAGGEAQRTVIARAVVGHPEYLLADEPTGNLDPKTSWKIVKILKEVQDIGTTVIMATHNVDIVNSLTERVILLQKGKLIKDEKKGRYKT
jgi:cell division transport system ATP-binding protein